MYILTISYQEQEHLEQKKPEKSGIITVLFYYKGVHKK